MIPSPHVFSVGFAFFDRVARCNSICDVAFFAFGFQAIRCSLVRVEFGCRFCNFAATAELANYRATVTILVLGVFITGIPAKIVSAVIVFARIGIMASFNSLRLWANECFQNKLMDGTRDSLSFDAQIHKAVSLPVFVNREANRWPRLASSTRVTSLAFGSPD